ncbi:MAG: hypothetical protein NTY55_02850 [Flavobacteriia bacterium]|nr:hypothetical protein [Flavobacteriia bacterium]
MGKIKELYMQMIHANDGNIPEEATIADLQRMKELNIYQWEEYEREREREKQSDCK